MSYSKLMEKVEAGKIEIEAWDTEDVVLVRVYNGNGRSTRKSLKVTGVPAGEW
jgi:hypothetical protein